MARFGSVWLDLGRFGSIWLAPYFSKYLKQPRASAIVPSTRSTDRFLVVSTRSHLFPSRFYCYYSIPCCFYPFLLVSCYSKRALFFAPSGVATVWGQLPSPQFCQDGAWDFTEIDEEIVGGRGGSKSSEKYRAWYKNMFNNPPTS